MVRKRPSCSIMKVTARLNSRHTRLSVLSDGKKARRHFCRHTQMIKTTPYKPETLKGRRLVSYFRLLTRGRNAEGRSALRCSRTGSLHFHLRSLLLGLCPPHPSPACSVPGPMRRAAEHTPGFPEAASRCSSHWEKQSVFLSHPYPRPRSLSMGSRTIVPSPATKAWVLTPCWV